jgi:hypothetical protein
MMIAKIDPEKNEGRELLLLGLSWKNVERLKAGQPIRVSEETNAPKGSLPHPKYEIAIIVGETELEMKQMFEANGLIGPDTKVTVDPRL